MSLTDGVPAPADVTVDLALAELGLPEVWHISCRSRFSVEIARRDHGVWSLIAELDPRTAGSSEERMQGRVSFYDHEAGERPFAYAVRARGGEHGFSGWVVVEMLADATELPPVEVRKADRLLRPWEASFRASGGELLTVARGWTERGVRRRGEQLWADYCETMAAG